MTRVPWRWACVATALVFVGCESEFQPVIDEELSVRSTFIEWTRDRVLGGVVPVLDGRVNNLEWGSPDDPARPYTYVQLTAENGGGSPGPSKFIAVKSAFTAEWRPDLQRYSLRNVYFVVQWADLTPSQYANSLIYEGPNLNEQPPVLETLQDLFYNAEGRARPENWYQEGGDDQLLVLIGTGDEVGADGRLFRQFGVPAVRNGSGFGPLSSGSIDAWHWSASTTNPLVEAFNPEDLGGDVDPDEGFAGYCQDMHVNASTAITRDSGPLLYIPNFDTSLPAADRVPLRTWQPASDFNNGNVSSSRCSQINMGMPFPWLHRYAVRGARLEPTNDGSRLFNYRVYIWDTKLPETAELWAPGQFVGGYLLGHDFFNRENPETFQFCLPGCPRPVDENDEQNCARQPYDTRPNHSINALHVRANGFYDEITRHWVVEMARPVTTPWGNTNDGSKDVEDHDFDDLLASSREFYVAFALWDGQPIERGGSYWGSQAVKIRFDPPPPRE